MAKPLPVPTTPPSTHASRVIRTVRDFAARPADTPTEAIQRVIDLLHIEHEIRVLVNPAYYRAISPDHANATYAELAARTGLAKSAVQRRYDLAAKEARTEEAG